MSFLQFMGTKWGNMTLWDWSIMLVAVVAIRLVSLSTRHFMKGVADFLSANRCAGRYLITIAGQMGGMGAITFVAGFQVHFNRGFPPLWWAFISIPSGLIIALSGWVFYRFRETRALTMAQFFEMRYTRKFRIFNGIVHYASGVINFGIFPAVAAHFFMYFCGLPEYFHIPGLPYFIQFPGLLSFMSFHPGNTFALIMAIDLGLALLFVTQGGQISIMVTECVQGFLSAAFFIIIAFAIMMKLHWGDVVSTLSAAPPGLSMLHPYDTAKVTDYNIWFYLINIFGAFYGYMSWLGSQGFYCSARTPHEQKMGNIIGAWRLVPQTLVSFLLPIAAYAILHVSHYAGLQAQTNATLATIKNPAIKDQMVTVIAMAHFLPAGVKGLLATSMLFYSFTCHDTYMHSWGSIFIQDIYMPLKRVVLSPERHIRLLRWSIMFVALFGFCFSLWYPQSDKIFMFFAITGTISGGGAGAVIVGGLYWKKGTTAAAYAAMYVGAIIGTLGVIIYPLYKHYTHHDFPINGQWLYMLTMIAAIAIYCIWSKIAYKPGQEFDLERMLHRGRYKVESDQAEVYGKVSLVEKIFGITEEFSLPDKILAVGSVIWNMGWFVVLVIVTFVHYVIHPVSVAWFAKFWHFYIWQFLLTAIPVTVWFQIGGVMDIKALFHRLAHAERDHSDDGRVIDVPEAEHVPGRSIEPIPSPELAMDGGAEISAEETK